MWISFSEPFLRYKAHDSPRGIRQVYKTRKKISRPYGRPQKGETYVELNQQLEILKHVKWLNVKKMAELPPHSKIEQIISRFFQKSTREFYLTSSTIIKERAQYNRYWSVQKVIANLREIDFCFILHIDYTSHFIEYLKEQTRKSDACYIATVLCTQTFARVAWKSIAKKCAL